jgi:hypothetical protein
MKKKPSKGRPKKQRAEKYKSKLSVKGSFTDVVEVIKKNKEEKK